MLTRVVSEGFLVSGHHIVNDTQTAVSLMSVQHLQGGLKQPSRSSQENKIIRASSRFAPALSVEWQNV